MGADRFVAFYGIHFEIPYEEGLEIVEDESDPRMITARAAKLDTYIGRLTDGEPFFVLIGRSLGCYGHQDKFQRAFNDREFAKLAAETRERLQTAGFTDEPALLFQFEAQY